MRDHEIRIDTEACTGCGLCLRDCPAGNLSLADRKAGVLTQNCIKCGHCVAVCPSAAVSMTGFEEPPLEIEGPAALDPAQLLRAIRARRSIRQFQDRPVPPETVSRILEAGRLTPTAKNAQDLSYLILQKEIGRWEQPAVRFFRKLLPAARLVTAAARNMTVDDHFFFKNAPAAIVILSKDRVSGSLAASNMALMAEAEGLGVLYSGFYTIAVNHSRALRRELGLRHGAKAVTTLVLGWPAVKYRRAAQREPASVRWL